MESNALDGMFIEAAFFLAIIVIMAIVSMIISKKQAKKYELEHPLQDRKDAQRKRKLVDKYLNSSFVKINGKDAAFLEISMLLRNKTINEEEFKILKDTLDTTSKK